MAYAVKKIVHSLRNIAAFLGGAALVVVFVAYTLRSLMPEDYDRGPKYEVNTYTVERGAMGGEMKIRGSLSGGKATKIKPPRLRRSRTTITYLIPEGTRVEKGDVLARFDDETLRLQIKGTEQRIEEAKANRFAVEVELEILKDSGDGRIRKSRFDWQVAEKELRMYEQGELPLETRRKRLRVEETETDFKRARTKSTHMPDLFDKGFVTLDRKREVKITLRKCEMALDRARSDLDVFLKYSSRLTLFKKTSNLVKAEKDFKTSESRIEKQLKNLNAKALQQKARLSRLRKSLAECREDLKKMTVESPGESVVIYGDWDNPGAQAWLRDMFMHVGGDANPWMTLFTLPDSAQLRVKMKIDERDIPNFKVGMPVLVDIESAGLRDLPGKISKIPEVTAKGDWRTDTVVKKFEVEVSLEREELAWKTGISADVRVVGAGLKDVIKVPLHAVRNVKGERFVYRVVSEEEGEKLVRTRIEVGKRGLKFAEVKTGLKEGDMVFLGVPPVELLKVEEALAMSGEGGPKPGESDEENGKKEVPVAGMDSEATGGLGGIGAK